MKKGLKFYIALWGAKAGTVLLKIFKRNASFFPGKFAIKVCKDFIGKVEKPPIIIAVTGTNGKTTVCNLIFDALSKKGLKVLGNRKGSNVNAGIATSLIEGVSIGNKSKYEVAVIELDERSSPKVFPYMTPTYLVCTNLFRDSIHRNAHPEFILNVINKYLPEETNLILNADDLISSSLGSANNKTFFGIDKLDTDKTESINIINDVRVCPKCHTKLKYNYVRYHHIGNAYCPNCGFKSPEADYRVTKVDYKNNSITTSLKGKEATFKMVSDSIFNIYNMIAVIALLSEFGMNIEELQKIFDEEKIVESRYLKEEVNNIKVISHMAKGQNPIACSCVFDYVKNENSQKEIILLLFDYFDAKSSSENITWLYDCDFEFLNSENIDKIVIGGPRAQDFYLRLLLAGVPKEKLDWTEKPEDTAQFLSLNKDKDVYILYELYDEKIADDVRKKVIDRINGGVV